MFFKGFVNIIFIKKLVNLIVISGIIISGIIFDVDLDILIFFFKNL